MPKVLLYTFLLLVVAFSYVATAGETYYRWTDERGNMLHSDRPPPKGTDYEVVSTDSNEIRKVDGDEGAVPLETKPRVGNDFDTSPKEPVEVKKSPETCKRARENLESLNSGEEIRMRNDKGEFRYLTDEEVAYHKKRARDVIRVHCE